MTKKIFKETGLPVTTNPNFADVVSQNATTTIFLPHNYMESLQEAYKRIGLSEKEFLKVINKECP
jgi:hypothetical protein